MPIDPKKYNSQTRFRLILWFIILLFTLGLGMVWLIYGKNAALLGFFCLLGMGVPVGLIAIVMFGLDKIVKKNQ
jgi:polyferredoxin